MHAAQIGVATTIWLASMPLVLGDEPAKLAENLRPPVRLEADGKPIDHGAAWGHAGPCVFDVDGDGSRDLVVGDFGGEFHLYRNVGTNEEPRYVSAGKLMAGDEPAKVWIYCCIGSSPQFADLDGDGNVDLISGSYDPGACYWFPGNGDGTFQPRGDAEEERLREEFRNESDPLSEDENIEPRLANSNGTPIRDRSGHVILRKPDQKHPVESFGSWPFPIDWDDDGDLDLVIGGFDGTIWLRLNEGTPTEFAFSEAAIAVVAGGEPISMKAEGAGIKIGGHAAVVMIDWDGDKLLDLVSGCTDGSVRWFRNVGEAGKPTFAAEETLVAGHTGSSYDKFVEPGETLPAGIRSQVAVADMNGDGRPDLLVGDYSQTRSPRPDLSSEEREKYEASRDRLVEAKGMYQEESQKTWAEGRRFLEQFPEADRKTDEVWHKWKKKMDGFQAAPEYVAAEEAYEAAKKELVPFLAKPDPKSFVDEYVSSRGFVWLYLRK